MSNCATRKGRRSVGNADDFRCFSFVEDFFENDNNTGARFGSANNMLFLKCYKKKYALYIIVRQLNEKLKTGTGNHDF